VSLWSGQYHFQFTKNQNMHMPIGSNDTSESIPLCTSIHPEHTPHSPQLHVLELLGQLLDLSLHWLHVSEVIRVNKPANHKQGPFELTKLSAQVSVLMAERNTSVSDPSGGAVAASYQNKGTFKTAKNIVKHRGIAGLYSGFNLHLRK
jgi:hypothetical protein